MKMLVTLGLALLALGVCVGTSYAISTAAQPLGHHEHTTKTQESVMLPLGHHEHTTKTQETAMMMLHCGSCTKTQETAMIMLGHDGCTSGTPHTATL